MDIEVKEEVFDYSDQSFDCDIVKEETTIQELNVPLQRMETAPNEALVNFEITEIMSKDKAKGNHKCEVCEKTFAMPHYLKLHILVHSEKGNFQCSICKKTLKNKKSLNKHKKIHTEVSAQCGICKRMLRNSAFLKLHMRQHGPPKKAKKAKESKTKIYYECDKCGKHYVSRYNMNLHIKRMHDSNVVEGQLLTCPHCDMTFRSSFNHKKHVAFHSQRPEVNFPCKICKKKFMLKEMLLRHLDTHSTSDNDAIFECLYCTQAFKKVNSLQSHMKFYHRGLPKIEGVTPRCTLCRKVFDNIEDLKKHVDEVHSFECAICGAVEKHKTKIEKHIMRVHLKIPHVGYKKDTKCPLCSKTMAKRHLKGHLNTHNKEKPFVCITCNKAYKTKSQLKMHSFSHVV